MFTGIVKSVGTVARLDVGDDTARLSIATGELDMSAAAIGDSISVNGVCLTAVETESRGFLADVSGETLNRSTLGDVKVGDPVNLEPALTLSEPLGGHLVTGHVDGVGEVLSVSAEGDSRRIRFQAPEPLARYLAPKGSVCVDGVSLTVNSVDGARFEVAIVPHTLGATVIGGYERGSRVNIEVDMIARYLERILQYTD